MINMTVYKMRMWWLQIELRWVVFHCFVINVGLLRAHISISLKFEIVDVCFSQKVSFYFVLFPLVYSFIQKVLVYISIISFTAFIFRLKR